MVYYLMTIPPDCSHFHTLKKIFTIHFEAISLRLSFSENNFKHIKMGLSVFYEILSRKGQYWQQSIYAIILKL